MQTIAHGKLPPNIVRYIMSPIGNYLQFISLGLINFKKTLNKRLMFPVEKKTKKQFVFNDVLTLTGNSY